MTERNRIHLWEHRSIMAIPFAVALAFSCQDEPVVQQQPESDAISFSTQADTAWSSRSARSQSSAIVSDRHFLGMMGKDSLFITLMEDENDTPIFSNASTGAESRSIYGSDGFTQFHLNAYVDNGSEFMKNQEVNLSGSNWNYSPLKYWPQTQAVHFFGYASNKSNQWVTPTCSMTGDTYTGTFSYTLPTTTNNATDAANQPDLVYAIVPNQTKQAVNGKVHLPFYHALSAVGFKVGGIPEDIQANAPATWKIGVSGVSTSGTCTYTYPSNQPLSFVWSNTNTGGTYTQSYNYTTGSGLDCNEQNTFALIPQDLDDAKLTISFEYAGLNYRFEAPLSDFNEGEWVANKKYTYVISISETVEVEISDDCTNTIKNNVIMRNTGLSDAYFRATIVGYWENSEGNVVGWWDPNNTETGVFKDLAVNNHWLTGTDGYYYYKYPVKVGDTPTKPLFDQYELKTKDANGAVLKLNVVVQAVKFETSQSSLKAAWPNAPTGISTTFENGGS